MANSLTGMSLRAVTGCQSHPFTSWPPSHQVKMLELLQKPGARNTGYLWSLGNWVPIFGLLVTKLCLKDHLPCDGVDLRQSQQYDVVDTNYDLKREDPSGAAVKSDSKGKADRLSRAWRYLVSAKVVECLGLQRRKLPHLPWPVRYGSGSCSKRVSRDGGPYQNGRAMQIGNGKNRKRNQPQLTWQWASAAVTEHNFLHSPLVLSFHLCRRLVDVQAFCPCEEISVV